MRCCADVSWRRSSSPARARSSDIEPEQHDVSVLDDVFLALGPNDAFLARALPTAIGHEFIVANGLSTDEPALEVGVNRAGRHGRGVTLVDRPRAHLLLAGSEVRLQSHEMVAGANQAIQPGR